MSEIKITIPTAKTAYVLEGIAIAEGYQAEVSNPDWDSEAPVDPIENPIDIANPITKAAFAKRVVQDMIKALAKRGHQMSDRAIRDEEMKNIQLT